MDSVPSIENKLRKINTIHSRKRDSNASSFPSGRSGASQNNKVEKGAEKLKNLLKNTNDGDFDQDNNEEDEDEIDPYEDMVEGIFLIDKSSFYGHCFYRQQSLYP